MSKQKLMICRKVAHVDRDETVNHIIREHNKLSLKEYESRHGWVGKSIHWELCKGLKFNHADKWYMHKPESYKWMQQIGKKEYESRYDWVGKSIH